MDDIQLIKLVSEQPILYDDSHPKFSDVKSRDKVWNEIASILKQPVTTVKGRWNNIQDAYRKTRNSGKRDSKRNLITHPYKYAVELFFLDKFLEKKGRAVEEQQNTEEVESSTDEEEESDASECDEESLDKLFAQVRCSHAICPRVDAFLIGLAPSLRAFTFEYYSLAKIEISEIIYKYERLMIADPQVPETRFLKYSKPSTRNINPAHAFLLGLAPTLTALSSSYFIEVKFEISKVIHHYEMKMLENPKRVVQLFGANSRNGLDNIADPIIHSSDSDSSSNT